MTRKTANVVGNFDWGDCFCEVTCLHGHPTRLFNIGRGHYVACDECRSYVFVGSNLMSSWRQENEDAWRRNSRIIKGYEEVDISCLGHVHVSRGTLVTAEL